MEIIKATNPITKLAIGKQKQADVNGWSAGIICAKTTTI